MLVGLPLVYSRETAMVPALLNESGRLWVDTGAVLLLVDERPLGAI